MTLRVVFDTNVLLSLYVFADSRYVALRDALERGRLEAVTNAACLAEFRRVLAYPQFGAGPQAQADALARYTEHAFLFAGLPADSPLPRCKDRDDQKFLELARDAGAAWLVTSDRALLVLARRQRLAHLFRVITPDAALAMLQESEAACAERSVASACA
ncbi:MAG TPA: putative toxin-antitoxin system toxin component, PIN family [Rhodocyclaceae bacterium]